MHTYQLIETAGGFAAIAWHDAGITSFRLPERSAAAGYDVSDVQKMFLKLA